MHSRTIIFIFMLAVCTAYLGRWYFTARSVPDTSTSIGEREPLMPTPSPLPPESVSRLILAPLEVGPRVSSQSAMLSFVATSQLAGVTLFGETIATPAAQNAIAAVREVQPNALIAVDHEGGTVQRLKGKGFTVLPSWQRLCTASSEERRALLRKSAAELSAVGITTVFAPVIDLDAKKGVLGSRACSDDPLIVAEAARDFIALFSAAGIQPVLKHYPGIGSVQTDLHKDLDALFEVPAELSLFETLAQFEPSPGIMTAHVVVKGLSEDAPCSLSTNCVARLQSTAPRSLIFTDALDMASSRFNRFDPKQQLPLAEVARQAVLAGSHVLVFGKGVSVQELQTVLEELKKEYTTNEVFRRRVAEAIARQEAMMDK